MYGHMPRHGKRASQHCKLSPLWEACVLQTYFTAKGRIDYFTVHQSNERQDGSPGPSTRLRGERKGRGSMDQPLQYIGPPLSAAEERLFEGLKGDLQVAARDLEDMAATIWSSYKLPKKENILLYDRPRVEEGIRTLGAGYENNDNAGDEQDEECDLRRILAAADALFRSAYMWVSDRSPTQKMTQQRAQILSDFAWGVGKKGKDTAFRRFKNPSSLTDYFRTMKQLLVYYYRVIYCEGGHFARPREEV
ncbi:hypothetical protein J3459_022353 [Metarhizium acridum]|nr:hypothetical protein J3459_022353 [Metarhizium acridum]